jgi:hypothetical protein
MKILKKLAVFGIVAASLSACEVFEDPTPETVSFRMDGPVGATVTVLYSKQFVAGVTESGVTQVEIFRADTVVHTLPIDTIIDVRLERRIYIQAEIVPTDTVDVDVRVDVNDRNLFDRSGKLYPALPWQFLYQYNTRFTENIEVII